MLNTTVTKPITGTNLIGLNAVEAINHLDRPAFRAGLKHVTDKNTHEYVAYRVGPHPFISLMVAHQNIVVMAELPDIDPDAREQQKEILRASVRGLIKQPAMA